EEGGDMAVITIAETPDDNYTVRLRSQNSDLFHDLIAELKDRVPSYDRQYDPSQKCWLISDRAALEDWLDYARVCGARVVWDGAASGAKQQPPPPRRSGKMVPADAFTALHLLPTAPPEVVKASYKALALIHHPDRGGDLEQMKIINQAYDLLEKGAA